METELPEIDLNLPYFTKEYPGVGGQIRREPSHFIVEEVPLYEASGEGVHLYVNITKENMNTRDVQIQLAQLFDLDPSEVGKAGLKDKFAITSQTFSIVFDGIQPEASEIVNIIEQKTPVKVNWAKYHPNKLRAGHLKGNLFNILITDPDENAHEKAVNIAEKIHKFGLPNYYGVQRTGDRGENVLQGWQILKNRKRFADRWMRKYLLSSYQSHLCNRYLAERVKRKLFTELLYGDVAKKHDTGGMFIVEDLELEVKRFYNREISFTAPMFGYKMKEAKYEAAVLEKMILDSVTISKDDFRQQGVKGTRRIARIFPEIQFNEVSGGLRLSFFLPKGSFATTLLREFMKTDKIY